LKEKIICLAFGKGGHQEQMQRLIIMLAPMLPENITFVIITDSTKRLIVSNTVVAEYKYSEARDKYSLTKSLIKLPYLLFRQLYDMLKISINYDILGIITTGPGVAIVPACYCKALGKKVIAFESWSRFEHASLTGKILHKFSDIFFIQNKSLKEVYKECVYKGKL